VSGGGPRYDPALVRRLARENRVVSTLRVAGWLINHGYDAREQLTKTLVRVDRSAVWVGSCVLANGEIADEYIVAVEGVEWYVKIYVDEEQAAVNVWSCWWEGTAH